MQCSLWAIVFGLALVTAPHDLLAQEPLQAVKLKGSNSISHGRDVQAGFVGPEAKGFAKSHSFPGSEIKDGGSYAFAKRVAISATYDGFKVEGTHLLIEGVTFTGALDIWATIPVVLRGVSIEISGGSPWGLLTRPGSAPVYVLWSEVKSRGGPVRKTKGEALETGLDFRGRGATVFRSHVSGTGDGIHINGSATIVSETLVDGLITWPGAHNDAVQLGETARDVTIRRSKILNQQPQTSAVYVLGEGVTIEASYLAGGGWTLYGGAKNNDHNDGAAAGVRVRDTIFGRDFSQKSGSFGPVTYWDTSDPSNNWTGNRFSDGASIAP